MRTSLLLLAAALPCMTAGAAAGADLAVADRARAEYAVPLRAAAAAACPAIPMVVKRGRRGMGEPGSFYAWWDWRTPWACNMVFGR